MGQKCHQIQHQMPVPIEKEKEKKNTSPHEYHRERQDRFSLFLNLTHQDSIAEKKVIK